MRSHDDVDPMMPRSGPSPAFVEHAYEMGTSELHRTSIMLATEALTTNRNRLPKDLTWHLRQNLGAARNMNDPPWRIKSFPRKGLTKPYPLQNFRAYKTELVHRQEPWRNMQDLEMTTLDWVDWVNHRRLIGSIHCPPTAGCSDERGKHTASIG